MENNKASQLDPLPVIVASEEEKSQQRIGTKQPFCSKMRYRPDETKEKKPAVLTKALPQWTCNLELLLLKVKVIIMLLSIETLVVGNIGV